MEYIVLGDLIHGAVPLTDLATGTETGAAAEAVVGTGGGEAGPEAGAVTGSETETLDVDEVAVAVNLEAI